MNGAIQLVGVAQSGPVFMLVLARVAGFIAALPGINGVPMPVRALAAVSISAVLFPVVSLPTPPSDGVALTIGLIGEALIGLVIGLAVRAVFAAVELGSEIMGMQIGLGLANAYDPITSQQESLVGRLYGMMMLVLFFVGNVHQVVLRALADSFSKIPPLEVLMTGAVTERVIRLGGDMFMLAMTISIPVTIVMLLAQLALGMLYRVVPQLNVFLIGFPVTVSLGMIVLGASLSMVAAVLEVKMEGLGESLYGLTAVMGRP